MKQPITHVVREGLDNVISAFTHDGQEFATYHMSKATLIRLVSAEAYKFDIYLTYNDVMNSIMNTLDRTVICPRTPGNCDRGMVAEFVPAV